MAAFGRRDRLRAIEAEVQQWWEEEKTFEANPDDAKESFLTTFPYPYMNGPIHLGHAFTITKFEFAAGFERLQGRNVLLPFAFHCTGMPIQSAATRLTREIATYGCPPKLPDEDEAEAGPKKEEKEQDKKQAGATFRGKKSKTAKKTGKAKLQWDILKQSDVAEEEIPKFVDPNYWMDVFPPRGEDVMRTFGLSCDWRRSFVTTSRNPFYDQFIRWQFKKLREYNCVDFGKRPTIYSPIDKQACMDHDRASGEGVNPQEYTLIKIKVKELAPCMKPGLEGMDVFLVAATLRPETMYGQTNCFVLPDGQYGAYRMKSGEVFICSDRSATNMAYQGMTKEYGVLDMIQRVKGKDMIGLPLEAPLTSYDTVYTLPLLTIDMNKGTGVVTSVPSDAPDDFAALRDWQTDEKLRKKHGVKEEWVKDYEVIPIINIPGYGDKAAVFMCEKLKIKSQKDKAKLAEAKDEVYLKGFYEGVMLVGTDAVKGKKVFEAKPIVRQQMIDAGEALAYYEPENRVMSRSGDECVVTFLDQWFIKYGEEEWKKRVLEHVEDPKRFNAYTETAHKAYQDAIGWLKEWACSRSFGLGTKVPWDEKFVIESLSDSTIYMAYYTIAHKLQGRKNGTMDGSLGSPNDIDPADLTPEVFDYIFLKKPYPAGCKIPEPLLKSMQDEFYYWYPMNLRVSGKDLIPNHLTMSLYNHAAIWKDQPELWPQAFYTNGHVQVDAEKMSKSLGNFITLHDACLGHREATVGGKQITIGWSADATRFTCADAGDGMEDANFACDTANQAILRLTTELDFFKSALEDPTLRSGSEDEYNFHDRAFEAKINLNVAEAKTAYETMRFRDALKYGFYGLQSARDGYRDACSRLKIPMHKHLVEQFIKVQTIVIYPICPHFSEYVWRKLLKNDTSVSKSSWPVTATPDRTLVRSAEYIEKIISSGRSAITPRGGKKGKAPAASQAPPTHLCVMMSTTFPSWKSEIIKKLASMYDIETKTMPKDVMKQLKTFCVQTPELKSKMKNCMQVASFFIRKAADGEHERAFELEVPYDELKLLKDNEAYIASAIGVRGLKIQNADDDDVVDKQLALSAEPGSPALCGFTE